MKKKLFWGLKILITGILYIIFAFIALKVAVYMGVVWLLGDLFQNLLWLQLLWPIVFLGADVGIVILYMRMKPKHEWQRAVAVFCVFAVAAAINAGVYKITEHHFSVYTGDKWNNKMKLRHRMLEDLESKYEFVGMTAKEVTDLLGEPEMKSQDSENGEIGYVVGDSMIDPLVFFLEIEKGVVTSTRTAVHG